MITPDTIRPTSDDAFAGDETLTKIEDLARRIDRDGFSGTPSSAIDHMLLIARATGSSPVLAGVLADTAEPPAVRERAFGLLGMQILSRIIRSRTTLAA